jgi:hypothetical protein
LKTGTQALKQNLMESENANERLSRLSTELRQLSIEQGLEYKRQSDLLNISEKKLKGWRLASLIEGAALALAAVVIIAGR